MACILNDAIPLPLQEVSNLAEREWNYKKKPPGTQSERLLLVKKVGSYSALAETHRVTTSHPVSFSQMWKTRLQTVKTINFSFGTMCAAKPRHLTTFHQIHGFV